MSRTTADIICRSLLAIVASLRKEYNLPVYNNVTIEIRDHLVGVVEYEEPSVTTENAPHNL